MFLKPGHVTKKQFSQWSLRRKLRNPFAGLTFFGKSKRDGVYPIVSRHWPHLLCWSWYLDFHTKSSRSLRLYQNYKKEAFDPTFPPPPGVMRSPIWLDLGICGFLLAWQSRSSKYIPSLKATNRGAPKIDWDAEKGRLRVVAGTAIGERTPNVP